MSAICATTEGRLLLEAVPLMVCHPLIAAMANLILKSAPELFRCLLNHDAKSELDPNLMTSIPASV
jgi:hypothetical protein